MESIKHKLLKQVALRWIQSVGCTVFATEIMWYSCGIPDAIGMKPTGDVYLVEAKDTTADLRADAKGKKRHLSKLCRLEQSRDIDFVYYIVSDRVDTNLLPKWVGVIDESGRVKRRAKRHESRTSSRKEQNYHTLAARLSWVAYGNVIRHEQEQPEFSLTGGD